MTKNDLAVKDNPYLASRALWDDMYGSVEVKLHNAQRLLMIAMVTILGLVVAMVVMTARNPIKPYVTVLKGSEVLTLQEFESDSFETLKPKLAIALTTAFIENLRNVSVDEAVNYQRQLKTISQSAGQASQRLLQFYDERELTHETRTIRIQTLLMKSPDTFSIRWEEISRDSRSGTVLNQSTYSAEITFTFLQKSQSEQQQKLNPIGFYVTHLAWAKDL